ncbi:hypothetical protein [Burkholderia cenocepacia]|nr:hypothetical protein [Burkholderia cenocepacia]MBJ9925841.1 hypothetical protein [Burkholderia cenocepacia]
MRECTCSSRRGGGGGGARPPPPPPPAPDEGHMKGTVIVPSGSGRVP